MWTYVAFGYKVPWSSDYHVPKERGGMLGQKRRWWGKCSFWPSLRLGSSRLSLLQFCRVFKWMGQNKKKKKKKIQLKIQDLFSHFKRHSGVEPEDTGVGVGSPVWHSTGSVRGRQVSHIASASFLTKLSLSSAMWNLYLPRDMLNRLINAQSLGLFWKQVQSQSCVFHGTCQERSANVSKHCHDG